MDRQTIKRTFEKHGEFLTVTQVAEVLGIDRGTARGLLYGLEYLPVGRKKLYFSGDVASRLMERKESI